MIGDLVENLGGWAWWILGLILLGLEILLPGAFFLWFGIAAIAVGISALFFDWGWQLQAIVFVVLALVLVVIGRRYFARRRVEGPDSGLNERAAQLVGSSYLLHEPILDGSGRVRIGDSNWRVIGPDCPSGTRVRVVAADGAILRVEPVD